MGKAFKLRNGLLLLSTEAPGGIYNSTQLKKIAALCSGDMAVVKATEDQRLALFVAPEQAGKIAGELQAVGLGVRHYQDGLHQPINCLGELCPEHQQDAMGTSMELARELAKVMVGAPVKIGINGCGRCCVATHTLDLSIVGDGPGYRISLGGKNSQIPEMASFMAEGIPAEQLPALVAKVIEVYRQLAGQEESFQEVMERCGSKPFIEALAPYSQDAAQDNPLAAALGVDNAGAEAPAADAGELDTGDLDAGELDAGLTADADLEAAPVADDGLELGSELEELPDMAIDAASGDTGIAGGPMIEDGLELGEDALSGPDVGGDLDTDLGAGGNDLAVDDLSLESAESLDTGPEGDSLTGGDASSSAEASDLDADLHADLEQDLSADLSAPLPDLDGEAELVSAGEDALDGAEGSAMDETLTVNASADDAGELPEVSLDAEPSLDEASLLADDALGGDTLELGEAGDLELGGEPTTPDLAEAGDTLDAAEDHGLDLGGDELPGVDMGSDTAAPSQDSLESLESQESLESLESLESPESLESLESEELGNLDAAELDFSVDEQEVKAHASNGDDLDERLGAEDHGLHPDTLASAAPAPTELGDGEVVGSEDGEEVAGAAADAFEAQLNASIAEEESIPAVEDENSAARLATVRLLETGEEPAADARDATFSDLGLEAEDNPTAAAAADAPGTPLQGVDELESEFAPDVFGEDDLGRMTAGSAGAVPQPIRPVAAAPQQQRQPSGRRAFELSGFDLGTDGRIMLQFASGATVALDPQTLVAGTTRELQVAGKKIVLSPGAGGGINVEIDGVAIFVPKAA